MTIGQRIDNFIASFLGLFKKSAKFVSTEAADTTAFARHTLLDAEILATNAKVATLDELLWAKNKAVSFYEAEKLRVVTDVEALRARVKAIHAAL
jgi:hypothetical protein